MIWAEVKLQNGVQFHKSHDPETLDQLCAHMRGHMIEVLSSYSVIELTAQDSCVRHEPWFSLFGSNFQDLVQQQLP